LSRIEIFVDSSVLIDYLKSGKGKASETLDNALGRYPLVIGDLVLIESLQGIRDDKDYERCKTVLIDRTIASASP
jgi:hypothetical protein